MRIAMLLFDRLTALDAVGPYEVLWRIPGATVTFVARERGPYRTDDGQLALVADASLSEVSRPDVVVVPGGRGTRALRAADPEVEWIRRAHESTRWTTSVCTGALLLGEAGLLEGLRATTHWLFHDRLEKFGATPTPDRVVEQGRIITAAGVSAGIDLALLLASRLAGSEVAEAIQLAIEYDPEPPFAAGAPSKARPEVVELARSLLGRATGGREPSKRVGPGSAA